MQLPEKRNELALSFYNEEFVLKTLEQINKDLSGLESAEVVFNIDFERDVLEQLIDQLATILLKMNNRNIQQFIYRVDLKESDFLKSVSKEDDFQELAFLIIRREAQKVYLRSKFS